jgi:hypothetical protein
MANPAGNAAQGSSQAARSTLFFHAKNPINMGRIT